MRKCDCLKLLSHKQAMATSMSTCRLLRPVVRIGQRRLNGRFISKHGQRKFEHVTLRSFATTAPRRESFAGQHAIGKVDMSWVFPYPTVGSEEQLDELTEYSNKVKRFLQENVNSKVLEQTGVISEDIIQGLKDLGLFGLRIDKTFGGRALSYLEYYRLLEDLALDSSIAEVLNTHLMPGLHGLLTYGIGDQHHKYLRRLASGELIATVALEEKASGSDIKEIKCKAHLSEDKKHWILNGEKSCVMNGKEANFMTVFAKTEVTDVNNEIIEKMTAFLVEKDFGGISTESSNTIGLNAANVCTVKFEDTPVPVENVLGKVGFGFEIAVSLLNSKRLSLGSIISSQLRRAVDTATDLTSQRVRFGRRVSDCELAREKIFNMSMDAYALESMTYMTAGQMDKLDKEGNPQDCSIEAAIVKVYASQCGWSSIPQYFQLVGMDSLDNRLSYNRMIDDFQTSSILKGSDDVLKLYIGLGCMQYAARMIEDRIRAAKAGGFRERQTAFWDLLRTELRVLSNRATVIPHPSFGVRGTPLTKTWLDPKLVSVGQKIEILTQSYTQRVFELLREHGKFLENEQAIVGRLAEVAINMYALMSTLARCNKAVILGLRNADHEVLLTFAISKRIFRETHMILDMIGPIKIHSHAHAQKKAGEETAAERRYLPSHPLEVVHRHLEHPKYLEQKQKVMELTK